MKIEERHAKRDKRFKEKVKELKKKGKWGKVERDRAAANGLAHLEE